MDERVAVVLGGASGLGRATAHALHAQGYRVTVADRDGDGAASVAAQIGGVGAAVDITRESEVEALFAEVLEREGVLHSVVNTVGVSGWSPIVDHDVDAWRQIIEVDLVGAFIVLKHAGRAIADGGSLVSLTSLNAIQPGAGMSAYCAAKAGLAMLTQVAALELGPRRIRVNSVAPGLVITPLTEALHTVPGVAEDYIENTPLGRDGKPEEVAAAVVYLCSDEAAWVTGEALNVNGGAHLLRYPTLSKHFAALS